MTKCILCKTETEGSIGAAGLRWSCICQPCKDREDGIALEALKIQVKVCNLFEAMFPEEIARIQADNRMREGGGYVH